MYKIVTGMSIIVSIRTLYVSYVDFFDSQTYQLNSGYTRRFRNSSHFKKKCFTSYFAFRIAVLPHSPGVVYYHLLLRWETRIPGIAPFSFRIGIWDLFVHKGQKSYTPTAFREVVDLPRSKMHETCLIIIHETGPGIEPGTFGLADECSTTELTLLLLCDRLQGGRSYQESGAF